MKPSPSERKVIKALEDGPVPLWDLTDKFGYAVGRAYKKGFIVYDDSGDTFMALLPEPDDA